MSNVLPQETKRRLDTRAWTRFVGIGATMSLLAASVAALSLTPTFLSIRVARAALDATPEAQAAREDSAKASRAQVLIDALTPLVATSTPTDALATVLALQPKTVSITSISYQIDPERFVLTGVSTSREAVTDFRAALVESGRFSSVEVPVAALAGVQEGRFTMTLAQPR